MTFHLLVIRRASAISRKKTFQCPLLEQRVPSHVESSQVRACTMGAKGKEKENKCYRTRKRKKYSETCTGLRMKRGFTGKKNERIEEERETE